MTDQLDKEIKAYVEMESSLRENHMGKFVIIYQEQLAGVFDNFDKAADEAYGRFGKGPYLIRQVGADAIHIPASIAYRVVHASH